LTAAATVLPATGSQSSLARWITGLAAHNQRPATVYFRLAAATTYVWTGNGSVTAAAGYDNSLCVWHGQRPMASGWCFSGRQRRMTATTAAGLTAAFQPTRLTATANWRQRNPAAAFESRIQMQITDHRSQITDHQITNHRSQM
jgi:hypothetical protein